MSHMNHANNLLVLRDLAESYAELSKRAQEKADSLRHAQGSEAAAGESYYQCDADRYGKIAEKLREVVEILD